MTNHSRPKEAGLTIPPYFRSAPANGVFARLSWRSFVIMYVFLGYFPGLLFYMFLLGGFDFLIRRADDGNYLASFRSNVLLGCQTLALRRPTFLVIGDSHAYSGIDFNILQSRLPGERVGGCTLPAMAVESLSMLTTHLDEIKQAPRRMLLLTSPWQFIDYADKAERLEQHRKILSQTNYSKSERTKIVKRYVLGEPIFGDTLSTARASLAAHGPRIEALIASDVESRIIATNFYADNKYLDAPITAQAPTLIAKFCDWVRDRGIQLTLAHIPESPQLERLRGNVRWYFGLLNSFKECGRVIPLESVNSGIDARHFINREFEEKYDYSIWTTSSTKEIGNGYDADHMNPLGAKLFTENITRFISLDTVGICRPQARVKD